MYNAPMERLLEPIIGIVLGFLTFLLAELRRRRKAKSSPRDSLPPINNDHCRRCFFFREHKRWIRFIRRKPVRFKLPMGGDLEDRSEPGGESSQSAKGVNE
jgi:hypothetical protein